MRQGQGANPICKKKNSQTGTNAFFTNYQIAVLHFLQKEIAPCLFLLPLHSPVMHDP
jgi:hypothetical protein